MSSGFDALAGGGTSSSGGGGGSGFDSLGGGTTTTKAQAKVNDVFGHSGGILGAIDSAAGWAASQAGGVGRSVYNFDKAGLGTADQFIHHPIYYGLHPGSTELSQKVAKPIAESYQYKYGPIVSHPLEAKSYHRAEADPFGTALDALTVATLPFTGGESATARGALMLERLGAVSDTSRIARLGEALRPGEESAAALRDAGHERLARMAEARSPLQREVPIGKGAMDAEGRPITTPYTLEPARTPIGRVIQKGVAGFRERPGIADLPGIGAAKFPIKAFRDEQRISDLPRQAQLHQFERSLTPLSRAEHEALHVAAEAPREIDPAYWRQRRVDYLTSRLAEATDRGTQADLRGQLDKLGATKRSIGAKIDRALTNPSPRFLRAYENARDLDQLSAERLGLDADRGERAAAPAQIMEHELGPAPDHMAATGDHPFGDEFRFPHTGPQIKTNASFTRATANLPLGEIKTPGAFKHFEGVRMATGRLATSPSAWTRDALTGMRYGLAHDFQDFLGRHAVHVPENGRVPQGWRRFEPTSDKTSRAVRERTDLHDVRLTSGEHAAQLDEMVKGLIPKGSGEDAKYMVPERYARAMEQEFHRSHSVITNLFDKPLDLWRAAVLKYRPAWLVNNIVGQHILSVISMNPQSIVHFVKAMRLEKGDEPVQNFLLRAMRIPAFRLKYRRVLEENGIHGIGLGTTTGTLGESEKYAATRRAQMKDAHPLAYGAPAKIASLPKAVGDANAHLNQLLADDIQRIAKGTEFASNPAAIRRAMRVNKEMGKSMSVFRRFRGPSDEDVIKHLTEGEKARVLQGVNRVLGNFNSLSPFERNVIRRIMPFYAWFKVIGAITKDMVVHEPQRLNWVRNLGVAASANPDLIPQGAMPSWLQGAIAVGAPKNGVQPVLSVTGANPFQTDVQLGTAAASNFIPGAQTSDTTGLLGPGFQLYDLYRGIDPFTGSTYKGAGASDAPLQRAAEGFLAGLPEAQLAQNYGYLGGKKPAKTYAAQRNDALWNFLGLPIKRVKLAKAHEYAKEGL